MNNQFTPGNWKIEGQSIITEPDKGNKLVIADLTDSGAMDKEQVAANGHLIAAAPELLEACKLTLENLTPLYFTDHLCIEKLKAAIAKAEGR